jgi:hypothetical protein
LPILGYYWGLFTLYSGHPQTIYTTILVNKNQLSGFLNSAGINAWDATIFVLTNSIVVKTTCKLPNFFLAQYDSS